MSFRKGVRFAVIASAIATASLAGPPTPAPLAPDSSDALIYVYRNRAFALAVRPSQLSVDDKKASTLSNNGCVVMRLPAGEHVLKVTWPQVPILMPGFAPLVASVQVEAGRTYYVKLNVFSAGGGPGTVKFREQLDHMQEGQATAEMAGCKPAVAEDPFDASPAKSSRPSTPTLSNDHHSW